MYMYIYIYIYIHTYIHTYIDWAYNVTEWRGLTSVTHNVIQ